MCDFLGEDVELMSFQGSFIETKLKPIAEAYNLVLSDKRNTLRLPQVQFIITCFEGASNRLPVVIEGPTGLGKTKALLTVAVAYLNSHPGSRVLYTTRTIPQLQNVDRDLHELAERLIASNNNSSPVPIFSVYLGIPSIRRLFCQRFLKGITMNPDELRAYRKLLDDPDRPEPCPDCNIRESRYKSKSGNAIFRNMFSLEEMAALVKNQQCPVPYMRSSCKSSSIVLSTYPYLFNDFWKATNFGSLECRNNCLPIIDEAHNLLDSLTDTPSLTICLTNELQAGQGLDLSSNIYYLSSLVDDLKYGYKKAIIGHLSTLYRNSIDSEMSSRHLLITKISDLHKKHKIHCDHSSSLGSIFNKLSKYTDEIRYGILSDIDKSFPYFKDVYEAAKCFKEAHNHTLIRDAMVSDMKNMMKAHRQLCAQNKKRREERDLLQREGKEYSAHMRTAVAGLIKQTYFDRMKERFDRAQVIHEAMISSNSEIESRARKIEELKINLNTINDAQSQSYIRGKAIIDRIYSQLKNELTQNSIRIDKLNDDINELQRAIDRYDAQILNVKQRCKSLLDRIRDEIDIAQALNLFYDALHISPDQRRDDLFEICQDSFSLYDYLLKFIDFFGNLLIPLSEGPIGEAELGLIMRKLNDDLRINTGNDIAQFSERCEKAVLAFEKSMLGSEDNWNGIAVYGLRQMFRYLSQIYYGAYGFAATLDRVGKAPQVTFHSLDPAVRFRDACHDLSPPILASATLSPVSDVSHVLGLENGIKAKISPVFPKQNYLSFAFLGCHSSPGNLKDSQIFNSLERNILRESIKEILAVTKCHTGLFCASHRVLSAVLDTITREYLSSQGLKLLVARSDGAKVNDDFEVLSEHLPSDALKGMSDFDARLKLFIELSGKLPVLLAGVTGGGLSEGVDFEGKAMELAIIIGVPYQDEGDRAWLNNRRTAFFKMRTGDTEIGKDLAYRQSAIRKVAQTAGRVHRGMKDKGAIILFDERLLGLKNCDIAGPGRYEILSASNTKRHWDIIQTRIFESLHVVIPPCFTDNEVTDISRYINRVFNSKESENYFIPPIIRFEQMKNLLMSFYQ